MNGSVLNENYTFKIYFYIVSMAKLGSKRSVVLIGCMKFLSLRLLFISINLKNGLTSNTAVMSRLVLLAATRICKLQKQISRTVGPSLTASI